MKTIEVDGKVCHLLEWCKPEDSDAADGEIVYAVYPAITGLYLPVLAVADGHGRFSALYARTDLQPLWVLEIPIIGQGGYIEIPKESYLLKVGDSRKVKPEIQKYTSHETD